MEWGSRLRGGVAIEDASAAGGQVDATEGAGVAGDGGSRAELVGGVVDAEPGAAFVGGAEEAFGAGGCAIDVNGRGGFAWGLGAKADVVDAGHAFEGDEG